MEWGGGGGRGGVTFGCGCVGVHSGLYNVSGHLLCAVICYVSRGLFCSTQ